MDHLFLQVSLDGATAGTNDAIRGAGSFARIVDGIHRLSEPGCPTSASNMVVTRLNAGEIADFVALPRRTAPRRGCRGFVLPAAACRTGTSLAAQRRRSFARLSAYLGEHPEVLTGDSFFALDAREPAQSSV